MSNVAANLAEDTKAQILEVATERFVAEASLSPMYDPGNEKIRR